MSENTYTPTTEEIIRSYAIPPAKVSPQRDGETFAAWLVRVSFEGHGYQMESEAAARRWLAAHDAEVRASVEAEETEWDRVYSHLSSLDAQVAQLENGLSVANPSVRGVRVFIGRFRRIRLRLQVPVEQEGTESHD